ncbi:MAG: thioredoxin family protein [Giesbergeria sp.]
MTQYPAASPSAIHPKPSLHCWWVVCLCAAWCDTCGDYRATFDAVAREWPAMRFEWVDIEDEAEVTGELDVETFPTVLVADAGGCARFLGPLLPQAGVLTRLISSLHAGESGRVDPAAQALFHRVRAARP